MFLKFKHGQIIIYKQNFSYTLSMIDENHFQGLIQKEKGDIDGEECAQI